ncbi:hypothetical protein HYH02_001156 [Chlamydomonas schloesseri]|nr:hypothetical protein HYH02_001156 [Chlamydomonas schloesseri]|eukprot:KAG2454119.1 hypothetical protein HYH02_001156 [Chlamydomonas schloesseri]
MSTAPSSEDTRRSNASGLQCDVLRTLVKNNADDDAISTYLGALSSLQTASYREQIDRYRDEIARTREERLQEIDRYRDEIARYREQKLQLQLQLQQEIGHYREEILRLQGDLKTTNAQYSGEVKFLTERLQTTMAQYLRLQGLLSMRGIMEYIQNTMFERTDVKWDRFQAMSCWQDYVNQRPSLQKCLMKRGLVVDTAGGDLVAVYKTLSNNIHDSMTPDEYQK